MNDIKLGTPFDATNRGTVIGYNDGKIFITLDDLGSSQSSQKHQLPLSGSWMGPNGEFLGGYPISGSSVLVNRIPGGQYYISGNLPSNNVFQSDIPKMEEYKPGRILAQIANGNRLYLDPNLGLSLGNALEQFNLNPEQKLSINCFSSQLNFSQAHRKIVGPIVRDIEDNPNRDKFYSSLLTSTSYQKVLTEIDNLNEDREIIYEYTQNSQKYSPTLLRQDLRTDCFGLNLDYPNHLFQTIKGTGVDLYGNILDLNRNIINKNSNKSLSFSFELNARKNLETTDSFNRFLSKFSFDLDKEGQFKLNVPASSSKGNLAFLTRYNNYSKLISLQNSSINPNQFIKNQDNHDIFHTSFVPEEYQSIKIENLPFDYNTDDQINFGTPYHNLTTSLQFSQKLNDRLLIDYDPENLINQQSTLSQIISSTITNFAGRSGLLNFDGSLTIAVGAEETDGHSIIADYQGSIFANIGRDKQNVSYKLNTDGDILIQVGRQGIQRTPKLELNVVSETGQISGIRFVNGNIELYCPGRIIMTSGQDTIIKTKANFNMIAENIVAYSDSAQRIIERKPGVSL